MPATVETLDDFLREIDALLELVVASRFILFRRSFRDRLPAAVGEVRGRLAQFREDEQVRSLTRSSEMRVAGLAGPQLQIKLQSFKDSVEELEEHGGSGPLAFALDKGAILLGSLGGAIPGFGSFAQELIDFILKELKDRWWFRKRK